MLKAMRGSFKSAPLKALSLPSPGKLAPSTASMTVYVMHILLSYLPSPLPFKHRFHQKIISNAGAGLGEVAKWVTCHPPPRV